MILCLSGVSFNEEERGVAVERAYCGSFMTSLEMAGLSLTILHLDDTIKRCLGMYTQVLPEQSVIWVSFLNTSMILCI